MINNKITRRLVQSNAGSVLVMTVILSMATIILGAAYLQYSDHYRRDLSYHIAQYMAVEAAHAAMVWGMIENPSGGSSHQGPLEMFYETDDGYKVYYRYSCGSGTSYDIGFSTTTEYMVAGHSYVTNTESDETVEDTCGHDMSTHSYADWLYITDRETQSYRPAGQDTLRFWGPDTLDGKVHSNDKLHFQQGDGEWPVFWEHVSSCSTTFSPVNADEYVHFYGGYTIPYSYFPFPLQADSVRKYNYYKVPNLGVAPSDSANWVTEITLLDAAQGFIVRHRQQNVGLGKRDKIRFDSTLYDFKLDYAPRYPYPPTGALFIEGELWITGAIGTHFNVGPGGESSGPAGTGFEGELTIGASGDIIIADDIVYKSSNLDGSVPITSPDVLGLISEKHILVWRNCAPTIKINAGLGAIGDQSVRDVIQASRCPSGIIPVDGKYGTISVDGVNCYGQTNAKNKIKIVGCLIQKERGLIHTHYDGGERGFFSKDYKYDKRFANHPPPHFFITRGAGNYYSEREPRWFHK